jgi:hypothetical protein
MAVRLFGFNAGYGASFLCTCTYIHSRKGVWDLRWELTILRSFFGNIVMKLEMRCRQAPVGLLHYVFLFWELLHHQRHRGERDGLMGWRKWVAGVDWNVLVSCTSLAAQYSSRISYSDSLFLSILVLICMTKERSQQKKQIGVLKTSIAKPVYIIFQYSQDFVTINIPIPKDWPRQYVCFGWISTPRRRLSHFDWPGPDSIMGPPSLDILG